MIISIDHGNKNIKCMHKTFTSGLISSTVPFSIAGDCLYYNGIYYALTETVSPRPFTVMMTASLFCHCSLSLMNCRALENMCQAVQQTLIWLLGFRPGISENSTHLSRNTL